MARGVLLFEEVAPFAHEGGLHRALAWAPLERLDAAPSYRCVRSLCPGR